MSFLLSLLAAKGLGALIGSLLLLTRSVPGLAAPTLVVKNDTLYLQTVLRHGFNKNLDQLLESGSLVAVAYTATILSRDEKGRLSTSSPETFFHSAVYDPVDRQYAVYRSELTGRSDSLVTVATRRQAKELLARIDVPLLANLALPPGREYSCRIEAALNTIRLEAMDNRELDLNVFWNYRYPRAVTPWIKVTEP